MLSIFLTKYDGAILGPIAKVLGYIMQGLYNFFDAIGSAVFSTTGANIGLCIITFTIVIKMLMMPLTFKQQKFSKLSQAMNPELQAIQAKYKDKKGDQQAMMKMNEETKMVYEKYGTSPTGSCLQMLIQMPIFFALYRVMMNIPAYVPQLKNFYTGVITEIGQGKLVTYLKGLEASKNLDLSTSDKIIDSLAKFSNHDWSTLSTQLGANAAATENINHINSLNSFFGINLSMSPSAAMGIALAIPVLAGLSQWYTTKLMQVNAPQNNDNPMGGTMKTMNTIFPIMSTVICFTMSSGLGLYWIASSVVTIIQQLIINNHFKKVEVNDLIKENIEKANKKRAKKGLPPKKITNVANTSARNVSSPVDKQKEAEKIQNNKNNVKESTEYYNSAAKPGSLAAKANMVKMYDEKKNKK